MEIDSGCIVRSAAGRDEGHIFFVLDTVDGAYALIVDGNIRRLEKPKKKKLRHLKFVASGAPRVSEKIRNHSKLENAEIRKALNMFLTEGVE